jgi:hypothetical protein
MWVKGVTKVNIIELKRVVKDLPERDVRSYLYHILLGMDLVKEKGCSVEEFINDLNELYDHIMIHKDPVADIPHQRDYKMVHILPGYLSSLRQVLIELDTNKSEFIIAFQ